MVRSYRAMTGTNAGFLVAGAAALIALLGLLGILLAGSASASPSPSKQWAGNRPDDCTFVAVPSVNNTEPNTLNAVDAISANNAWAVGNYAGVDGVRHTLVEHWSGSAWSAVTSPDGGYTGDDNYLFGVSALSANDVWAVGHYRDSGHNLTLVLHWDGAVWAIVASPSPSAADNGLYAVTAVAANDVWATGDYNAGTNFQTLVEHWDGTAWSVVLSPSPLNMSSSLDTLAAVAINDVWAAGESANNTSQQTLVEHWDGTAWSLVPSPNQGSVSNRLTSIAAAAANDVWSAGEYSDGGNDRTLVEHWNGSAWTIVPSPNVGSGYNALNALAAVSAGEVWAVGAYSEASGSSHTLAERWDGSAWSVMPTGPDPGSANNEFNGLAVTGPGDMWAVGIFSNAGTLDLTLAKHWNGIAWSVAPSDNPGLLYNWFSSIVAIASDDVWAVGVGTNPSSNSEQPLTERWDGTGWNLVQSPAPDHLSGLQDVDAVSANDVWAVGDTGPGSPQRTLAEHWDGTAWSAVPSPNASTDENRLYGVAVVSANDVWAVGEYHVYSDVDTLTEHWNGSAWSVVPSPNLSNNTQLNDVAAVSSDDVWAVGYFGSTTSHSLVEHWDGAIWSLVSTPLPSTGADELTGVAALAANDVWSVGIYTNSSNAVQTLVEHWNGTAWSIVPSPNVGSGLSALTSVSALASDDVWAAGYYQESITTNTLVEHWNGSAWSVVPSANVGNQVSGFVSIAAAGPNDVWAGGVYSDRDGPSQTLTEHYRCAPGTPTPTPTGSPASPSLTPPVTPTACAVQFHDVPAGSTFYPYVRCMACRGIINGYPCGGAGEPCDPSHNPYFRPNTNVTRGQIAKIVALSSGNHSPVSGQSFHDVPPSSTFYTYTEQLAALGVMSGYPCGGVGEPCDPGHLPYFRPNSAATRAQLSKIDAIAAGYHDTPSGQRFEDVQPGSTFYTYTYELVSRGVMSGYPCGGVGEPCVPPANLPYFRPRRNVTRGQTSKIVSNTFFPECSAPARTEK